MEHPNGPNYISFTPKGHLVNQMLAEGWKLKYALAAANRLFSADGRAPSRLLHGAELENVKVWIAACDQQTEPVADDYAPRVEEVACGGLEVRA